MKTPGFKRYRSSCIRISCMTFFYFYFFAIADCIKCYFFFFFYIYMFYAKSKPLVCFVTGLYNSHVYWVANDDVQSLTTLFLFKRTALANEWLLCGFGQWDACKLYISSLFLCLCGIYMTATLIMSYALPTWYVHFQINESIYFTS